MRILGRTLICLFLLTLPAYAVPYSDILGPRGVYTLAEDLICEGDGPAITVKDGAVLDLGGHLVSRPLIGILLEGQGAVLKNGRVESSGPGENGIAVQVQGVGRHEIAGVQADALWFGFVILSDHNRLTENMSSADTPFSVGGRASLLRRNTGGSNGAFVVGGEGNWLIENASLDGHGHGFIVRGTRNRLVGNSTTSLGRDQHRRRSQPCASQPGLWRVSRKRGGESAHPEYRGRLGTDRSRHINRYPWRLYAQPLDRQHRRASGPAVHSRGTADRL